MRTILILLIVSLLAQLTANSQRKRQARPVQESKEIVASKEKEASEKQKSDFTEPQDQRIMLLNAYNFDFGENKLASNYVGHLNLFAPSLDNKRQWGFNTGIMKISYGQKDTASGEGILRKENILINPLDTLYNGMKYLRQLNAHTTVKKNTIWSFYVQPFFELTRKNKSQHVFLHLHMELVASKFTAVTSIKTIAQDTAIFDGNRGLVLRSRVWDKSTYSVNALSGYFGLGPTFDLQPWKKASFFFQPTIGFTSNKPSPSSVDIDNPLQSSVTTRGQKERTWHSFYLVRAYYTQKVNDDATIIVGTDIRGLLPLYAPQYAAYIGLNLQLDSILKLIKPSSEEE
ncbi:MAG: hypothetical protein QM781_12365 [Chitinophagaceae bacterium]